MRIVLASTSPFRLALLHGLGIAAELVAPAFDEIAIPGVAPVDLARTFAAGKARSLLGVAAEMRRVSQSDSSSVCIVGADQVLELEGEIIRKPDPRDVDAMVEQLMRLAGRTHALHSAVHVIAIHPPQAQKDGQTRPPSQELTALSTTELSMRTLSRAEAERYVALDSPAGAVGSYLYERRGRLLFDAVRGSDDSAIIGLPLVPLLALLRSAGFDPLAAE
jgi:septum formation protein